MVTGHSHHIASIATQTPGFRLSARAHRLARLDSGSADRLSRPSPEAPFAGPVSTSDGVRTFSGSPVIRLCVAALVVNVAPWAAAGEIPSVAQASSAHVVTSEQYGIILLFAGIAAAVPVINTVLGWMGFGRRRQIEQPLEVTPAPRYIDRAEHDKIASDCALQRRLAAESAKQDRESVQRQIDHLSARISQDLKEHNAAAEERSQVLHGRITALLEPLGAMRQRLDDHIHDERAHAKGKP